MWQQALILAILSFLISIGFGIWCVINRLYDFRTTKNVARGKEQGQSEEELAELRLTYEDSGTRTWKLFWWQIGTFAFAVLTFILSVAFFYSQKLF